MTKRKVTLDVLMLAATALEVEHESFTVYQLAERLGAPLSIVREAIAGSGGRIEKTGRRVGARWTYRTVDLEVRSREAAERANAVDMAELLGGKVVNGGVLFTLDQVKIIAIRLQLWRP